MTLYHKYLLPGLVFQSVVIGGGYATGRELIEFFFASGLVGGVLGLLSAGVIFGVVLATGFEFARVTKAYDYRHFCQALLGRGWILFEIAYFLQILLILAVIGSASGSLIEAAVGLSPFVGTLILMILIGFLTYGGSKAIKRALAGWSVLLYGVYIVLFVLAFHKFGPTISSAYTSTTLGSAWISSGILYSGYNLAVLPAVLFVIAGHKTRRETVGAGLIAGAIAVIPAILFFIAMMGQYPVIADAPVPATYLMEALNFPWLTVIFQVVVFGTFVETGAALLHAVNERLQVNFQEQDKTLPKLARPVISVGFLVLAIFAANMIGIIDLIARGYGILTLVFIAILIVPLMTLGLGKILKAEGSMHENSKWQPAKKYSSETGTRGLRMLGEKEK